MRLAGRHSRQTRLVGVGEDGQARLGAADVVVTEPGLAGWVMARYLAGAGVGALTVADADHEAAARAVDDAVVVRRGNPSEPGPDDDLDDLDPAAREVARGARAAVRAMKAILSTAISHR
jgi:hypothetical protein